MRVIKRDGTEVPFESRRIRNAVAAANRDVTEADRIPEKELDQMAAEICSRCGELGRSVSVEEIQDMIIDELDRSERYRLMRAYMEYRFEHALRRKGNSTDGKILSLLSRNNEEAMQENANKNPVINSTMRDYMAGEVSRDLVRRVFMPEDVMKAHDEGIIHVHDTDYISGPLHNCDLINLEDMLQNGTVISGTMILSSVFHYEFVFIHPFSDGNGRMARLWQTALLMQWNEVFQYLPLESRIQEFQDGYYDAIAACHAAGNSDAFIEFMLDKINLTMDWALEQLSEKDAYLSEAVQKLLDVMEYDVPYSASQLMNQLKLKSRDNFRKLYLNPTLEKGLIVMGIPDKPTSRNQTYIKK